MQMMTAITTHCVCINYNDVDDVEGDPYCVALYNDSHLAVGASMLCYGNLYELY